MAWRRPVLFVCIATIVLGLHCEQRYRPRSSLDTSNVLVTCITTVSSFNIFPRARRALVDDLNVRDQRTTGGGVENAGSTKIQLEMLNPFPGQKCPNQNCSNTCQQSTEKTGRLEWNESSIKAASSIETPIRNSNNRYSNCTVKIFIYPNGTRYHIHPVNDTNPVAELKAHHDPTHATMTEAPSPVKMFFPPLHTETTNEGNVRNNTCSPRDYQRLMTGDSRPRVYETTFGTVEPSPWTGRHNDSESSICHQMTILSICITFILYVVNVENDYDKSVLQLLQMLQRLPLARTLTKAVKDGYAKLCQQPERMNQLEKEVKRMLLAWHPILPGVKSDYFTHQACLSAILKPASASVAFPGIDLEKETNRVKKSKAMSAKGNHNSPWTSWRGNYGLKQAREHTVYSYPLSFLPSAGSSPADAMSHLGSRLASLHLLPPSCSVSRVRLAEAGFYYDNTKTSRDDNNSHEVVCYKCGLTYSQWTAKDNPIEIHRQIKPDCEHIKTLPARSAPSFKAEDSTNPRSLSTGAYSSGPSIDSGYSSGSLPSHQQPSLGQLSLGLSPSDHGYVSDKWSQESSGQSFLSEHNDSGFSYGGLSHLSRDSVTSNVGDLMTDCAAIAPPPFTDDDTPPARQSARSVSSCGHSAVRNSVSPSNSAYAEPRDSLQRAQDIEDRPDLEIRNAVYSQFCSNHTRRATFANWPLSHVFPPEDLVMQGFYYAGYDDCIRCFYCGVGLKSWDTRDDVMTQHIRWRPSCGYVLNTKGRRFVERVLQGLHSNGISGDQTRNETETSRVPVRSESAPTRAPAPTESVTPGGNVGLNSSKEVLKHVEDMGFSKDDIRKAVKHLQETGQTRISPEGLVEIILEMQSRDSIENSQDALQTDEAVAETGDCSQAQWMAKENERLRSQQTCKLCHNARVGMIFLPCGHVVTCTQCGPKVRHCPTCNQFIRATANIFLN